MSNEVQLPAKNPIEALVTKYRDRIEGTLNQMVAFPAFLTAVLEDCANNQKLKEAAQSAPETMIACLLQAAQLKLLPGSKYKRYFLIPRNNHGRLEVTGLTSYQGLAEVAQRHDRVHSLEAFCVYEGEEFTFDPLSGTFNHKVNLLADRSDEKIVGAYMVARITEKATHNVNHTPIVWAMSIPEILKRRACSEAWKRAEKTGKNDSPWHLWFADMCRKTVVRAGIVKGAVPQEMWLAGALDDEDHTDMPQHEPLPEGPTRQDELAQRLGVTSFDKAQDQDMVPGQ